MIVPDTAAVLGAIRSRPCRLAVSRLFRHAGKDRGRETRPGTAARRGRIGRARGSQAGYADALREAAGVLAARARTQYVMAFSVALLYASAGEKEAAIDWLERAYQQHGALLEYIRMSPEFEALRPDPRFQDLLRRLNLADDQLAGSST